VLRGDVELPAGVKGGGGLRGENLSKRKLWWVGQPKRESTDEREKGKKVKLWSDCRKGVFRVRRGGTIRRGIFEEGGGRGGV